MPALPPRRSILRALGAAALGGGALALPGPAAAFHVIPEDEAGALLEGGCGATAYHQRLIDEAVRAAGVTLTDDERAALLARLACPTCSCPLGLFDDPPGGPLGELRF